MSTDGTDGSTVGKASSTGAEWVRLAHRSTDLHYTYHCPRCDASQNNTHRLPLNFKYRVCVTPLLLLYLVVMDTSQASITQQTQKTKLHETLQNECILTQKCPNSLPVEFGRQSPSLHASPPVAPHNMITLANQASTV